MKIPSAVKLNLSSRLGKAGCRLPRTRLGHQSASTHGTRCSLGSSKLTSSSYSSLSKAQANLALHSLGIVPGSFRLTLVVTPRAQQSVSIKSRIQKMIQLGSVPFCTIFVRKRKLRIEDGWIFVYRKSGFFVCGYVSFVMY